MVPKCLSRSLFMLLIATLAIGTAACSAGGENLFAGKDTSGWTERLFSWDSKNEPVQGGGLAKGTYAVDPNFEEFYQALGGEEVLGPAISAAKLSEGKTTQYTESSLMVFDPLEPASTRFKLAPLGVSLGVEEEDSGGITDMDGRMINGHFVISDFLAVYENLGGARFVGPPISNAAFNGEKQRVEQYFENLGFYQLAGDSEVHFMPFGAYACDRNCRNQEPVAGIPIKRPMLPEPFLKKTLELGLPFVGKPLTGLHLAPDGKQEVIFENLVLIAESDSPDQVSLRPIAAKISEPAKSLRQPEESALSVFIEIENGLGYNVPRHFLDYLEEFGGIQVAGKPISEVFSPEPGVYWQCFTNLCLHFNLNEENDLRLQPVPLGAQYKDEAYDQVRDFASSQDIERIDIRVWEEETFVSTQGSQQIHTAIYDDGKPLMNFEPLLIATMPDGSQRMAYFPPSNEEGCSSIQLAPIEAPNGTLIAYRVCLYGMDGQEKCVGDNYLIWEAE